MSDYKNAEDAINDITYDQLLKEAQTFLMHCHALTLKELIQQGEPPRCSVNTIHGMASRVIAESALTVMAIADNHEAQGGRP